VSSGNDLYLVENGRAPRRLTQGDEAEAHPEFSPDGTRLAYVRSGDLYLYDLGRGQEHALTHRASADVQNGRVDGVYEEELGGRAGKAYAWSPDGGAIAYLQLDSRPVPLRALVDFLTPAAAPITQRFPTAGDPNPIARLGVIVLGRGGRVRDDVLWPLQGAEYLLPQLTWTPDSRQVVWQTLTRRQDRLEVRRLDVAQARAGAPSAEQTILAETDDAWVNAIGPPVFLRDGRTFLWLSERDGPRHLYRCTIDDGRCRALTRGEWSVDRLVGMDQARGVAYFAAGLPSPRERQLYSVTLDGETMVRLTAEAGTHEVSLAPNGGSFVDVHSTASTPPRLDVVRLPDLRRQTIDTGTPAESLARRGNGEAEWVEVKAEGGTILQARLARPARAPGAPPPPAVVLMYGGPRGQLVRDVWSTDWSSGLERLLVAAGYVVWTLDNRGTSGRGHAFETPLRGELGRTELADQLAGIEALKARTDVDGRRLGACGISYGGYLALYAAAHAPDVFQAVAAGSPVTDWRCYDSIYTERYLGLLGENGAGYAKSAIVGNAASLRAPLLLFHGTLDDNVHLDHTQTLIEELRAAGRTPAVELQAGEGHTYRTAAARIARDRAILAHFDRYLK